MNAGLLTFLSFLVLGLFGIVAYYSLRKHIRGIEAPTDEQVEAMRAAERDAAMPVEDAAPATDPSLTGGESVVVDEPVEPSPATGARTGHPVGVPPRRSPKASDRS